jgi:hypothetical protein
MATRGQREFVQVLRLLEVFRPEDVLAGIREARRTAGPAVLRFPLFLWIIFVVSLVNRQRGYFARG